MTFAVRAVAKTDSASVADSPPIGIPATSVPGAYTGIGVGSGGTETGVDSAASAGSYDKVERGAGVHPARIAMQIRAMANKRGRKFIAVQNSIVTVQATGGDHSYQIFTYSTDDITRQAQDKMSTDNQPHGQRDEPDRLVPGLPEKVIPSPAHVLHSERSA